MFISKFSRSILSNPSFKLLPRIASRFYSTDEEAAVFIANLSYDTTSLDLQEHLSGYGQLEKAFIIQDRETRRSKGYGFAIFSEQKDADRVIKELDGSVFNGRRMVVRRREPRVVNESAERAEQQSNIEESAVESNESTEEVEATQKEQSSNQ